MSSVEPRQGERRILDEDCAEDNLKNGILTLTNQRILFQRTEGTMLTFSKKTGEVLLDIPLEKIISVKTEGFIMAKFVIATADDVYKFGVFSPSKWARATREQVDACKKPT
jgi:Bacterial PH domain